MSKTAVLCLIVGVWGALPAFGDEDSESAAVNQIIPAHELARIRASLPKVAYQGLREVLRSPQTLWYNDEVMTPSYQDSVGAASNATWPDLVAASESVIGGLYDRSKGQWHFPFATTAGTDHSTNIHVENFVFFPFENGRIKTTWIKKVIRNAGRYQWDWTYPEGTIFGEVLFIRDGNDLLPVEIRTRKRYGQGWAMNAFRPFPTAESLADAIRKLQPVYFMNVTLRKLVAHLENPNTLEPKTLAAKAALAPTFHQEGWVDSLPEFGDNHLVRQLLKTTAFEAAYDTPWKQNGSQLAHAASTQASLSIVPNHYEAGLLEVTDAACMRCHQEGGRLVSEFYPALHLYGELWGKDGIFSFHPYYEQRYSELRHSGAGPGGMKDNRQINPVLANMDIFAMSRSRRRALDGDREHELEASPSDLSRASFLDHIKPILDANCTECHTGGTRKTDFSRFPFPSKGGWSQKMIVNMILGRAQGASPSMPPGVRPKLTSEQIRQIEAWRDAGLPL